MKTRSFQMEFAYPKDMDVELGRKRIQQSVADYVDEMKAQKGMKS